MFNLAFCVMWVMGGVTVGRFLSFLCKMILGDTPLTRLLRLVISIVGGVAYLILVYFLLGVNFVLGTVAFFAPSIGSIIMLVLNYMFK